MKKKIVVGAFEIESNSLTAIHSTRRDFNILTGQDMRNSRVEVFDYFEKNDCEVIPTLYAGAVPGGSMVRSDFESILSDLIALIPADGSVDGVWLMLHGAMDVEELGSGDLIIARKIREIVGKNVPIAIVFDLHANVDTRIAEYANVICGFRTAPHIDIPRTQLHAAELLLRCLELNYMPHPIIIKVPVIASGDSMTTDVYPGKELIEDLWRMEAQKKSMCLNIFLGNPWVDSPYAGGAVVVIPNPEQEREAGQQAVEMADRFWKIRSEFKFRSRTADIETGIQWALTQSVRPIFLNDTGDNVSGGGSGDNAALLQIFLGKDIRQTLFAGIADRRVVERCSDLQEGDKFTCTLGATLDPASTAISCQAVFKKRAHIHNWPALAPIEAVLLEIQGIDVLVTAERMPVVKRDVFERFGITPSDYRFIIVKLGYIWPEFQEIAADVVMLFTPGSTCEVVEQCNFQNIPRPVYPIDRDMVWKAVLSDQVE